MCNFRIKCNERITLVFSLGLIIAFLLTGCATQWKNSKTGAADVDYSTSATITSIGLSEAADTVSVVITSSEPLTYTSVKQPLPLGVVLYFPNTRIDVSNEAVQAFTDPVTAIHAGSVASANDTARIEILLAEDAPYNVVQDVDALKIQFAKSNYVAETEQSDTEAASATEPEATIPATPVQSPPDTPATSQVAPTGTYQGTGIEVDIEDQDHIWVNRIDFLGEKEGKSTLSIETTKKVEYKIKKVTDTLLELRLADTKIAEFRQRPLITTRFESAVNRIMPVQLPSMKNFAMFSIELREPVSYYVEQVEELLLVHFDASSVPPAPAEETNLPEWKKALQETLGPADLYPTESQKGQAATMAQTEESEKELDSPIDVDAAGSIADADQAMIIKKKTKKFTGEKIALDFFQTDVKNVFRILREVSGKNFAIDKDVSGKVTLTLEKPVPWDQVMDLVLRMNQLGLVAEGDIYRIATLKTLKQENELRKAQIAALQKEKEQLKALEPLETRYIPISYSNATTEILPHIQKIVTPDRGSATVDEKNNQIIITDTIDKIRKAQAIATQIDKVTAQVIIEARVVEVEESYSKELGFEWGLEVGPITMFNNGSNYTPNVAMNYAAASASSSIGLTYNKIAGTPITLDAALTALETNGKGKVLSAPKIVTLNNKKAKIKQGTEVGYLERDSSGGSSVKFKDVDLLLEVTPHVTPDNRIALSINITKNDVTGYVDSVPTISTNEANTELLVNDGDTVVIGGIIKSSQTKEKEAFPGLHKVPVLGWMFQSNLENYESLELLIFMNPKIVQLEQRQASYMDQ